MSRRLEQRAHLRPRIGLLGVALVVGGRHPVLDRRLERGPRADAVVPARDAGSVLPHARKLELVEPPDIGRRRRVRQRPALPGEIGPIPRRRLDQVEQPLLLAQRLRHRRRVESLGDHLALDLRAFRIGRLGELGLHLLRGEPRKRGAVGGGEGDRHAGDVHVFVHQLCDQPQPAALERVGRQQRRTGKHLVDVMHDDGRLDDDLAVVHQGRDHRVGVELHVSGIELVAPQRQQLAIPIDALLGQSQPRLDRAHRRPAVVQGEHAFPLFGIENIYAFEWEEALDPGFNRNIHPLFAFRRYEATVPEGPMSHQVEPQALLFADDGSIPNNPRLPFLVYRDAIDLAGTPHPEEVIEEPFARHGWGEMWRNGIYRYVHYHSKIHEALGIARGRARVRFGGVGGEVLDLAAGDVAVLPAGTGHQCLWAAPELCVIGAYPKSGKYDLCRGSKAEHAKALTSIPKVPVPDADPVHGRDGPLTRLWRA